MNYYSGYKLLNTKDLNNQAPEIFITTGNRSCGKTTFFSKYLVDNFINNNKKFCLLYRFNYELDDISDKFKDYTMTNKRKAHGRYHELFLCNSDNKKSCGYGIAINNADQIKRNSHLFSDTSIMLFDEFQSETNHYCTNEIQKFISIHTSIARGNGEVVRYLPVIMLSNTVSLLNPYFTALGISQRLTDNTKIMRGDGYVLEQYYNNDVAVKQKQSAFNRAFANDSYINYSSSNTYLKDNKTFIESLSGNFQYIMTFKSENNLYTIKKKINEDIYYCDDKPDITCPFKYCKNTEDLTPEFTLIRQNLIALQSLRIKFETSKFRFKNIQCKNACINFLSY